METNEIAALDNDKPVDLEIIERKAKFTGKVVKTTLAGAIVDIGLGIPGVVHISQLQAEPTNRVEDVVKVGQSVEVWVKRVEPKKQRIELTMIEPLDLEWREIKKGMNVKGKVTRLEKFGAFVEIGAERPGLVHISEMTHGFIKAPEDFVKEGDEVEAQVLAVNRRKKQIKLSMKVLAEKPVKAPKPVEVVKEKEVEETPKEEPIPTAMEVALREAMERSNSHFVPTPSRGRRKPRTSTGEMERIMERTLQNKVRTGR
jgi:small subunit ribosomal protein S1